MTDVTRAPRVGLGRGDQMLSNQDEPPIDYVVRNLSSDRKFTNTPSHPTWHRRKIWLMSTVAVCVLSPSVALAGQANGSLHVGITIVGPKNGGDNKAAETSGASVKKAEQKTKRSGVRAGGTTIGQ